MSAIKFVLGPEQTIVRRRASEADIASSAASTEHRHLATILLSEVRGLESEVLRHGLKLLELELVHASGGGKGQDNERRESGEEHDGQKEGETTR